MTHIKEKHGAILTPAALEEALAMATRVSDGRSQHDDTSTRSAIGVPAIAAAAAAAASAVRAPCSAQAPANSSLAATATATARHQHAVVGLAAEAAAGTTRDSSEPRSTNIVLSLPISSSSGLISRSGSVGLSQAGVVDPSISAATAIVSAGSEAYTTTSLPNDATKSSQAATPFAGGLAPGFIAPVGQHASGGTLRLPVVHVQGITTQQPRDTFDLPAVFGPLSGRDQRDGGTEALGNREKEEEHRGVDHGFLTGGDFDDMHSHPLTGRVPSSSESHPRLPVATERTSVSIGTDVTPLTSIDLSKGKGRGKGDKGHCSELTTEMDTEPEEGSAPWP